MGSVPRSSVPEGVKTQRFPSLSVTVPGLVGAGGAGGGLSACAPDARRQSSAAVMRTARCAADSVTDLMIARSLSGIVLAKRLNCDALERA